MEIERRFIVDNFDGGGYPSRLLSQAYICRSPVIRVRDEGGDCWLTVKGAGRLAREEFNLRIKREQYEALLLKADGGAVVKRRHLVPLEGGLTAEVDVFSGRLSPLVMAEVEFESVDAARAFVPPGWFGAEVTENPRYSNASLSLCGRPSPESNI
jgi:CYTH domain-containing protein